MPKSPPWYRNNHPPSQRNSPKRQGDHVRAKGCCSREKKHLITEDFCRPRKQHKKDAMTFWVNRRMLPAPQDFQSRPRRLHVIRIAPRIPPIFCHPTPSLFVCRRRAAYNPPSNLQPPPPPPPPPPPQRREGEPLVVHIIKRPFANRAQRVGPWRFRQQEPPRKIVPHPPPLPIPSTMYMHPCSRNMNGERRLAWLVHRFAEEPRNPKR